MLTLEIAKLLNPMFFYQKGMKDVSLIQDLMTIQSRLIEIDNLHKVIQDRKEMFPSKWKQTILPNGDLYHYEDSTAKYYLEERIPEMEEKIRSKEKEVEELVEKLAPYYEKIEP